MKQLFIRFLDFFYPLAKPFMNKQTYYYAACGGINVVLSFIVFYFTYHNFLKGNNLDLGFYVFEPHSAAYFISFILTFPIGFAMSKYVVWQESDLRGRQQLFRQFVLVILFICVNYGLLKLFVEVLQWWPLPSQMLATGVIIVMSYLAQRNWSFK